MFDDCMHPVCLDPTVPVVQVSSTVKLPKSRYNLHVLSGIDNKINNIYNKLKRNLVSWIHIDCDTRSEWDSHQCFLKTCAVHLAVNLAGH